MKTVWEILKWCSNICYVFGTMLLLSPVIADSAITPWCLFFLGNIIMFTNFVYQQNWSFVCLSVFFFVWDLILIISRLTGIEAFTYILPLIHMIEKHVI